MDAKSAAAGRKQQLRIRAKRRNVRVNARAGILFANSVVGVTARARDDRVSVVIAVAQRKQKHSGRPIIIIIISYKHTRTRTQKMDDDDDGDGGGVGGRGLAVKRHGRYAYGERRENEIGSGNERHRRGHVRRTAAAAAGRRRRSRHPRARRREGALEQQPLVRGTAAARRSGAVVVDPRAHRFFFFFSVVTFFFFSSGRRRARAFFRCVLRPRRGASVPELRRRGARVCGCARARAYFTTFVARARYSIIVTKKKK